ncbi:MAG: flagellar motor protein MotB [Acidobacteriota bacterium]
MRRRSEDDSPEESQGPTWMITFADLCILLLAFFVLIFSMSTLDRKAFLNSFKDISHARAASRQRPAAAADIVKSVKGHQKIDIREMEESEEFEPFPDAVKARVLWIKKDRTGEKFSFTLGENLLFEPGSDRLNPDALPFLEAMAGFLREPGHRALIDHHTEETTSTARLHAVLDFMLAQGGVGPEKLAAGLYKCPPGAERIEIAFEREAP